MKMKNLKLLLVAVLFGAAVLLTLPANNLAQGRYSNVYSKRDVSGIISNLEKTSNSFRKDFDRELDKSPLNGTSEEDRINTIVKDYENALNRLRRDFDSQNTWWQSRNEVQSVMSSAQNVNSLMNNLQFARKLEKQWRNMRRDLNKLADTFDLASLDGSVSGNGSVPNWAIGTFAGRNPQTGGSIVLTVTGNGYVTADIDGSLSTGTIRGEQLTINGATARIYKINNGIRTTRNDNGESIEYFASGFGSGNNGGNVPSWAIGTFTGRNPQNNGNIILTINRNGSVTADIQGAISNGTINGETLNINGANARIYKINNGIRTTRTDNGESIDYLLGGNNWNNGGNVPNWAVGTFTTRNPQTGGTITLTITANGYATADFQGAISNGTVNGEELNINGAVSKLRKINNGIRTTRRDNGESLDYFTNYNGNNNGNNTGGNVPNWAIGTFAATNPQNGGLIRLTITREGNVTVDLQGSLTYGTVNGEMMTINGATAKLKKINNGIRTTRVDNGESINYVRQ